MMYFDAMGPASTTLRVAVDAEGAPVPSASHSTRGSALWDQLDWGDAPMVETETPSRPSGNHLTLVASPAAAAILGPDRQSDASSSPLQHQSSLLALAKAPATRLAKPAEQDFPASQFLLAPSRRSCL